MKFLILLFLSQNVLANLNILAVGDTGKANEMQYKVGETMNRHCRKTNCELALLLGDNIYDEGISSPQDPQMIEKFEKPYAGFPVPFYVALGNHDYGKLANDWKRGQNQIAYSQLNPQFKLPAPYYTFVKKDVRFIVLDTSQLFHDNNTDEQKKFIQETLKNNQSKWVVAVAHHPYISNGDHGNAGQYDGVPFPPYSGSVIKKIVEKELCPYVDLFISGHDHSLQTLTGNSKCQKPVFVVSGGGASASKLKGKNPALFEAAVTGFTAIEFKNQSFVVTHYSDSGDELHRYEAQKKNSLFLNWFSF